MIEIIPAILPHSLEELREGLARLKGLSPSIQIDLVGENILHNEEALPEWEDFDFEFDLMTNNSLQDARGAVALGASRIVVHSDFPQAKEALDALQQTRSGDYPILVGLALPSDEKALILEEFKGFFDFVQVMGIAEVGAQGRPFDPRCLDLVTALRRDNPGLSIQVDGAAAGHIEELVAAGANRLVVGSALVGAENPKEEYKALYNRANVNAGKS